MMVLFVALSLTLPARAQSSANRIFFGTLEKDTAQGDRVFQSDTLADSVGYVTHVQYNDPGNYYSNLPAIVSMLKASGIRHVRDGWANDWTASSYETKGYNQLCAAGMKLTLLMANQPTTPGLNAFQGYVGGCVEAWEGYNECDGAASGACTTAVSWLPAMLASAHDLGIPALGPSNAGGNLPRLTGNIQNLITAQNLHSYRDNNQNPEDSASSNIPNAFGYGYGSLSWWMTNSSKNASNLPYYVTEVGYKASPTVAVGNIPEAVQGSYLARTLLWNYKFGVKRTFLYEFFDEGSSMDWGVVHSNLTPKAAYTYVKSLVTMFTDPGPAFIPARLVYTMTGGDASLQHLLFQRRDGSFWLVLWLGQSSWNNTTHAMVSVVPKSITITTPVPHQYTLNQFASSGFVTTSALGSASALKVNVNDQLTVLKIN